MSSSGPAFLSDSRLKLLIFGGKGGVGKTTSATATALHLAGARPGARVLLLSTDPAHSVADCLAGAPTPANLLVVELSAEEEHRAFMAANARHFKTIAERGTFLDGGDIDQFVQLSIPGLDELMAFLRVARWMAEDAFDVIIVDTAPSGHTLKLLAMSELLNTWMEALDALLAKHRCMASLFAPRGRSGGAGGAGADETDAFLSGLREQVDLLTSVLTDEHRCRFVPVLLAEPMSIAETTDILIRLDELGVAAPELVMNRLIEPGDGEAFASQRALQRQVMGGLPEALSSRVIWGAPLACDELTGAQRLASFLSTLAPLSRWIAGGGDGPVRLGGFRCEGAAMLPPPTSQTQLMFFAGKGGTGKTTMACAAAVQLASLGRRCLLVSTDPAHSLGDCLGVGLRDEAVEAAPDLWAIEIDAGEEFEKLRAEYQRELEGVLESMFSTIDLSLDREAMEKLLDLAPPGLDECMALLRMLEQLDARGPGGGPLYDTIVIDTAPTGHLLRLLELPELIEHWLSSLFSLFVKYDHIFRLPALQARLVDISRGIKRLRATLADAGRCRVQIVTIPTEMAFAECGDLVKALGSMRIDVRNLFINLALLPDGSPLGRAVCAREAAVRAKHRAALGSINQVTVYRCGDPRGVGNLRLLARALYGAAGEARRAA